MDTFEKIIWSIVVFIVLLLSVMVYIGCGKEAEYYTKITGIEVTRSDAFWLELDPSKHVVMIEKNANK